MVNFTPKIPEFPEVNPFLPCYGKFDLTTYIQGASDYEIMANLVQLYNIMADGYNKVEKLSTDTVTAYNQLQAFVNDIFSDKDLNTILQDVLTRMFENGTMQKYLEPLLGYVTPEMFGAIGDGLTDDSDSFQKMLDTHMPIILQSKTYIIKSTLNLSSSIKMSGVGDAKIKFTGTDYLFYGATTGDILSGISFEGINTETAQNSMYHGHFQSGRYTNCNFTNFNYVFDSLREQTILPWTGLNEVKGCVFTNCVFPINIQQTYLNANTIDSCYFYNCGNAITCTDVRGLTFNGCWFERSLTPVKATSYNGVTYNGGYFEETAAVSFQESDHYTGSITFNSVYFRLNQMTQLATIKNDSGNVFIHVAMNDCTFSFNKRDSAFIECSKYSTVVVNSGYIPGKNTADNVFSGNGASNCILKNIQYSRVEEYGNVTKFGKIKFGENGTISFSDDPTNRNHITGYLAVDGATVFNGETFFSGKALMAPTLYSGVLENVGQLGYAQAVQGIPAFKMKDSIAAILPCTINVSADNAKQNMDADYGLAISSGTSELFIKINGTWKKITTTDA